MPSDLSPDSPADPPCTCTALRRAARSATAAYDAALRPASLRVTQFAILRILARLGPLPVTRLAEEAALDRSTMGRNLDPLERRGLVHLAPDQGDRRARVAALTESGAAAIEAALPHWRAVEAEIGARLSPGALASLAALAPRS
ncbi:MarR family winged helix-turn-helix transcriptional regulator [Methylobacterium dankookense]|uniref:HTH-type transcriptional repressor NicR n=1 Tax=Methylobacterium dankookense TaxID=560405 RepID=A0A564G5M6_9HYPH|nr:MarR family winged helix-turn-helix transcriptional regulator [Methylobacterium dankookense]GJD59238.1 HTH-type transcriptional repressor NicR [Methylobacterium dankookense]VUF15334.1 HTH-type transcriptional repressor NicR [Methylobacterium dankookense]